MPHRGRATKWPVGALLLAALVLNVRFLCRGTAGPSENAAADRPAIDGFSEFSTALESHAYEAIALG